MIKEEKVKKNDVLKLRIEKLEETLSIHKRINSIDENVSELINDSKEFSLDVVFCDLCGVALKKDKAKSMKFMGTDLDYSHPKLIEKMLDEDEEVIPGVANIVEKYFCKNCDPRSLNKKSEKGNFFSRMWKKINNKI